jgi:hypothetical protein
LVTTSWKHDIAKDEIEVTRLVVSTTSPSS